MDLNTGSASSFLHSPLNSVKNEDLTRYFLNFKLRNTQFVLAVNSVNSGIAFLEIAQLS